jgi:hypothetical protein
MRLIASVRFMHPRLSCSLILLLSIAAYAFGDDRLAPPQPKSVTLKLQKANVAQALGELTRQTGIVVADRLPDGEPISLELSTTTFWPALDAIARAAHGRVELYGRDSKLALVRQPAGFVVPPISYSGLFRTTVKRITAARDLESGTSTCMATLEIAWEPGLEPLFLQTVPHGLIIRDDQGHELPAREEGSVMAAVDGRLAKECDVPLPALPRSQAKLGLLEGRLSAIAPSKMLAFRFETLDRLAEVSADSPSRRQQKDDVTCRISKVQLANDRWTVQVALDYPQRGVRLESYQSRVVSNELLLEAKDGSTQVPAGGYVVEMASERKALISYHFLDVNKTLNGKPAEWKVRYRTPAALVEVPFTFSFKDLPLP